MDAVPVVASPTRIPVYLDHAATTPCDPEVLAVMLPHFTEAFGNPASVQHARGRAASDAVERARAQVARLLGCRAQEVIFTSGATEANNLAIQGVFRAYLRANPGARGHVVTSCTEHKAVLEVCRALEAEGCRVTRLPPDAFGRTGADSVRAALTAETFLVSVMWANNETGILNDVAEIAAICRAAGVLFHCDATQWAGKGPIDLSSLPIDLLALSSHKLYGPQGAGALYVRASAVPVPAPILHGGGHELGLRPGTLNLPAIAGFGHACALAYGRQEADARHMVRLRDRFASLVLRQLPIAALNGANVERLPNISSITVSLPPLGTPLVSLLTRIECASGSACTAADRRPSHVLRSLGISARDAANTIRISVGRTTTVEEVDFAAAHVVETCRRFAV
jgi:cysteine desulfurase